jgi:hypothetical protein
MQAVGLKWEDFTVTDNTCRPHPQKQGFNLFSGVQQLEASIAKELENDLLSFGKGFTVLESGTRQSLDAINGGP